MLDLYDFKLATSTGNPTSHHRDCAECRAAVSRHHIAPHGVPEWHIVGSKEIHEVILTGGRGSHIRHATPSCTCTHGTFQRARNQPCNCKHVKIAFVLLARWLEGDEKATLPCSDYDLWAGDEIEPNPEEKYARVSANWSDVYEEAASHGPWCSRRCECNRPVEPEEPGEDHIAEDNDMVAAVTTAPTAPPPAFRSLGTKLEAIWPEN